MSNTPYEIIDALRIEISDLKAQLVNASKVNSDLNEHIDKLELILGAAGIVYGDLNDETLCRIRRQLLSDKDKYSGSGLFLRGLRQGLAFAIGRIDSEITLVKTINKD